MKHIWLAMWLLAWQTMMACEGREMVLGWDTGQLEQGPNRSLPGLIVHFGATMDVEVKPSRTAGQSAASELLTHVLGKLAAKQ